MQEKILYKIDKNASIETRVYVSTYNGITNLRIHDFRKDKPEGENFTKNTVSIPPKEVSALGAALVKIGAEIDEAEKNAPQF